MRPLYSDKYFLCSVLLSVVVKFSDAVRRAELDMELQQKEMDLRSKLYELWEIRCKERTIMGKSLL